MEIKDTFFLDPKKVKQCDIVFKWEALFGVFHMLSKDTLDSHVRTTFKKKLFSMVELLLFNVSIFSLLMHHMARFSEMNHPEFDFLHFFATLEGKTSYVWTLAFAVAFVTVQASAIIFLLCTLNSRNVQASAMITILRCSLIVTDTVFPLFFMLFASPLNCDLFRDYASDSSLDCGSVDVFFFRFLGIVGMLAMLPVSYLSTSLIFDFDPTLRSPKSMAHSRIAVQHWIINLICTCVLAFGYSYDTWIYPVICGALLIFQCGSYIVRVPYYNQVMNTIQALCCAGCAWICILAAFVHSEKTFTSAGLNYHSLALFGFSSSPFIMALAARMIRLRHGEFHNSFVEQSTKPHRVGDKLQWDHNDSELCSNKALLRIHRDVQTLLLRRGVMATFFQAAFFCTDVELYARPLQETSVPQNSVLWRKMLFLVRLQFAHSIIGNGTDGMTMTLYAAVLWFYTKSIADCNSALRAAMARRPPLDAQFMIYRMQRYCEGYKQIFTENEDWDVMRLLELRNSHNKVIELHNDCVRNVRHMWKALSRNQEQRDGRLISKLIKQTVKSVIVTQRSYGVIMQKFPQAKEPILHFAQFKRTVMHDETGAQILLMKSKNVQASNAIGSFAANSVDIRSSNGSNSVASSTLSRELFDIDSRNRRFLVNEMNIFANLRKTVIAFVIVFLISALISLYVIEENVDYVSEVLDSMDETSTILLSASSMSYRIVGMENYRLADNEEMFEKRADMLVDSTKNFQESSFTLFESSQEKSISDVVDFFEDPVITSTMINSDGDIEEKQTGFRAFTTEIVNAARSVASMSMGDFEKRDSSSSWGILKRHLMSVVPDSAEILLNKQTGACGDAITMTKENLYIGVGMVLIICLVLTVHSAIKMARDFNLFSQRIPAYSALGLLLPSMQVRNLYQQLVSSKDDVLIRTAQQQQQQNGFSELPDKDPEFFKEEDEEHTEMNSFVGSIDPLLTNGSGGSSGNQHRPIINANIMSNNTNVHRQQVASTATHNRLVAASLKQQQQQQQQQQPHHHQQQTPHPITRASGSSVGTSPMMSNNINIGAFSKRTTPNQSSAKRKAVASGLAVVTAHNGLLGTTGSDSEPPSAFSTHQDGQEESKLDLVKTSNDDESVDEDSVVISGHRSNFYESQEATIMPGRNRRRRSSIMHGTVHDDNDTVKKRSLISSLFSRYSLKMLLTWFMSVSVIVCGFSYFMLVRLDWFDNASKEIRAAAMVRHYSRFSVVNIFEAVSDNQLFEDRANARISGIESNARLEKYWSALMYGENFIEADNSVDVSGLSGAAFRNDDRKTLLFNPSCLRADKDCSNKDRFPFTSFAETGLNEYISKYISAEKELITLCPAYPSPAVTSDYPLAWFVAQSDIQDLGDGLQTMANQFWEEKSDYKKETDTFFTLTITAFVFSSALIYFLVWLVLLRSIQSEMRDTYYFLSITPKTLLESSNFIVKHCMNNNEQANW